MHFRPIPVFSGILPFLAEGFYSCYSEVVIMTLTDKIIKSWREYFQMPINNEVKGYDEKFSIYERSVLIKNNIPPKLANRFNKRFGGWGIVYLTRAGVSPEQAEEYHQQFTGRSIAILKKLNIDSKEANPYLLEPAPFNLRFYHWWEIMELRKASLSPRKAQEYDPRLDGREIAELFKKNIHPEQTEEYLKDFQRRSGKELQDIIEEYDEKFSESEITDFVGALIYPEEANNYYHKFNSKQIILLYSRGIIPLSVSLKEQKKLYKALEKITEHSKLGEDKFFISSGSSSIIIFNAATNTAWKFSKSITKEARLLRRVRDYHGDSLKNIVQIRSSVQEKIAIELEYLEGKTLDQVVEEEKLSSEKVIRYAGGIFNGLLELKQAGIWHHRDIRPANIMIDEEKDRAVIIDLGIATTDKDALAEDNRRFGSPSGRRANDLTSLGQVVYKMAIGEHIFAESKSMERTTYADKLRDHRDWIYEEPEERLPPYLRKVEETVKDRDLCEMVNFCLNSKGADEEYQRLEERFRKYDLR